MESEGLVAWLALTVGILSLGWQVFEARRSRETRVALELQHAALPTNVPDGPQLLEVPAIGNDSSNIIWPAADEPLAYVIVVAAVNRGESHEWVQDMRVLDLDGSLGAGANPGDAALELPPRGRRCWAFRVDRAIFDLGDGFDVDIVLGSKTIRSGPYFLDVGIEEHIARHNARFS